MMYKIRKTYSIVTALLLLLAVSACKDDTFGEFRGDSATVKVAVNIESGITTRADGLTVVGPADYDFAAKYPMIGDGTRARYLTYALYEDLHDGTYRKVETPDENGQYHHRHEVHTQFPYSGIPEFTVAKNRDYVMVFWAQSKGGAQVNTYYNVSEFQNIIARYDSREVDVEDEANGAEGIENEESYSVGQLNNMDSRDAFCASYRFNINQTTQNINITLRRAVAQVNIGFTKKAWDMLADNNVDVRQTSVSIAQVARRLNLVENKILMTSESDPTINGTTSFTIAGFSKQWIPEYWCYNSDLEGQPANEEYFSDPQKYCQRLRTDDDEYIWTSMSYIFSGGTFDLDADDGKEESMVDIIDVKFYDGEGNDLGLPFTRLDNVKVRRNWRTNIILDEYMNVNIVMDMNISPNTINDFNYEAGNLSEGELAPGLSYKRNTNLKWNGFDPGLNFYVSSVRGLKWLADRSNGLDFSEEDIPYWEDENGRHTYKEFLGDDGLPSVKKYEDYVFNLVQNMYVISSGVNRGTNRFTRTEGLRVPWNFEECEIYLTCDLDFNDDPEVAADWHGFNSNLTNKKGENFFPQQQHWTVDNTHMSINGRLRPSLIYNRTDPPAHMGFSGMIDGQGFTIYNMTVDNTQNYRDMNGLDFMNGWRKLNNSGLICTAGSHATVKNLRLYNAHIKGDWNVGGFVGYYIISDGNFSPRLTIENCQIVNSTIESVEGEVMSPSDDANVGAVGGSIRSAFTVKDTSVINCVVNSAYIGGAFIGIPQGSGTYENCVISNVDVIFNEMNDMGLSGQVPPRNDITDPDMVKVFGRYPAGNLTEIKSKFKIENVTSNRFFGVKFLWDQNKNDLHATVAGIRQYGVFSADPYAEGFSKGINNLPLRLFPRLSTLYSAGFSVSSHIMGTPSVVEGDKAYGIYIDMKKTPTIKYTNNLTLEDPISNKDPDLPATAQNGEHLKWSDKGWSFKILGETNESESMQRYVINVQPEGFTYGLYFDGNDNNNDLLVSNLIITGLPTIDYGIFLSDVNDVTLDGLAIYDVRNTIGDAGKGSSNNKRLTIKNCDFRGITAIGTGYASDGVKIENTAFNIGSGISDNIYGRLNAGSDITMTNCRFRTSFRIVPAKGVTLKFKDCKFGPPALQSDQTVAVVRQYVSGGCTVTQEGEYIVVVGN